MPIAVHHHRSALGEWTHAEWRPRRLAGVVDLLWSFDGTVQLPRERVFPHGRLELVVQLGTPHSGLQGDRLERFPPVCVGGLATRAEVIVSPPGRLEVVGVRLHPAGAYRLLARSLRELVDLTAALDDVVAEGAAELAERCAATGDAAARLRVAAGWIAARLRPPDAVDPAVAWAVAEIERRRGALSIAALRQRTGWSKSRFTELFGEQVGVTPKRLARIHRFRRALDLLPGAESLAAVALAAGYYDQPHFNGEFREHAGLSPGEFLASARYPTSTSLAEA